MGFQPQLPNEDALLSRMLANVRVLTSEVTFNILAGQEVGHETAMALGPTI